MSERGKLHPVQIFTITVSSMLGVQVMTVQNDLVRAANQDAWISMLIAGAVGVVTGVVAYYPLARMYPQSNLAQTFLSVYGKVLGRLPLLMLTIAVLLDTGYSIRIFVEVIKVYLLDKTPIWILVLLITVSILSVAQRDIRAIGTTVDFMFPVYMFPFLLIIALSFMQTGFQRVQPVLYQNWSGVLKGVIPGYRAIIGYGAVSYMFCYVTSLKNTLKWYVFGMIASISLFTLITVLVVAIFGPEDVKTMIFPLLELTMGLELPVKLMERLEAVVIIIIIPGVFARIMLFIFVSIQNFTVMLGAKPKLKKLLVYLHFPLLYFIAIYPSSSLGVIEYLEKLNPMPIILGLMFVPLTALLGWRKKRRKTCAKA